MKTFEPRARDSPVLKDPQRPGLTSARIPVPVAVPSEMYGSFPCNPEPSSAANKTSAGANMTSVRAALGGLSIATAPAQDALEVVFTTANVGDGRWANCGWLQELPDTASKVVWDNPAYLSPNTAKALGVLPDHTWQDEFNPYTKQQMPKAKMATLTLGGRQLELPVWILPGVPDNTVILRLGYGRTESGHVGNQVGFNTYALRTAENPSTATAPVSGAWKEAMMWDISRSGLRPGPP